MITKKQIKRFESLCRSMNKLLEEIRVDTPEANYYLQEDMMNLMKGPSHDDSRKAIHENVSQNKPRWERIL